MYAILCGFVYQQSRRLRKGQPRLEDLDDPPPPHGDVEVGFFPAASVWPAALGLGAVNLALGLVFGIWFFVIAAILVYAAMRPDSFAVQRSTTIKAPPEKIVSLINDFHNWGAWSPWEKLDPAMKTILVALGSLGSSSSVMPLGNFGVLSPAWIGNE